MAKLHKWFDKNGVRLIGAFISAAIGVTMFDAGERHGKQEMSDSIFKGMHEHDEAAMTIWDSESGKSMALKINKVSEDDI